MIQLTKPSTKYKKETNEQSNKSRQLKNNQATKPTNDKTRQNIYEKINAKQLANQEQYGSTLQLNNPLKQNN